MGKLTGARTRFLGARSVGISTAVLAHLRTLTISIGPADDVLQNGLADLVGHLHATIPSYCGLELTLLDHGWPVTLTDFSELDHQPLSTSLTLSLGLIIGGAGPGSRVTFYASAPGSLVDLAADLAHALGVPVTARSPVDGDPAADGRHPAGISLDTALPPRTLESGMVGLEELSTINRAVGFLIDQGHRPIEAHDTIRRGAVAAGLAPHLFARRLLEAGPD